MAYQMNESVFSELSAAALLEKHGWAVAIPFAHVNPFDLIIYKEGVLRSVQVKSAYYDAGSYTVINIDFRKYKDIDFVIINDRRHRNWFIIPKGTYKSMKKITLNPERMVSYHNNWNLIK